MKKLLSILAAVGLTATAGAAVVACGSAEKDKDETFDFNIKAKKTTIKIGETLTISIKDFKDIKDKTDWKVVVEKQEEAEKTEADENDFIAAEISEINEDGEATLTPKAEGKITFHFTAMKVKEDEKIDDGTDPEPVEVDYTSNSLTIEIVSADAKLKSIGDFVEGKDLGEVKDVQDALDQVNEIVDKVEDKDFKDIFKVNTKLNEDGKSGVIEVAQKEPKEGWDGSVVEFAFTIKQDDGEKTKININDKLTSSDLGDVESVDDAVSRVQTLVDGAELTDYVNIISLETKHEIEVNPKDDVEGFEITGKAVFSYSIKNDENKDVVDATITTEKLRVGQDAILTINTENATPTIEFESTGEVSRHKNDDGTWTLTAVSEGEVVITVAVPDDTFRAKVFHLIISEKEATEITAELDSKFDTIGDTAKVLVKADGKIKDIQIEVSDNIKLDGETVEAITKGKGTIEVSATNIDGTILHAKIISVNIKAIDIEIEIENGSKIELEKDGNMIESKLFKISNYDNLKWFDWTTEDSSKAVVNFNENTRELQIVGTAIGETKVTLTASNANSIEFTVIVKDKEIIPDPELIQSIDEILKGVDRNLGEVDDWIQAYGQVLDVLVENEIDQLVKLVEHTDTYLMIASNDETKLTGETTFVYSIKNDETPKPSEKIDLTKIAVNNWDTNVTYMTIEQAEDLRVGVIDYVNTTMQDNGVDLGTYKIYGLNKIDAGNWYNRSIKIIIQGIDELVIGNTSFDITFDAFPQK